MNKNESKCKECLNEAPNHELKNNGGVCNFCSNEWD